MRLDLVERVLHWAGAVALALFLASVFVGMARALRRPRGRATGLADQDNRTYVGVRALALALGVPESGINWDGPNKTATLTKDTTVVKLVIGSSVMLVNEKSQTMDATPFAANDRTYLPVRYLAEAFGFTVDYDEVNNQAIITSPAAPEVPEENGEVTTPATIAIIYTEADSASTKTIKVGDKFDVTLESNASTGYSWQLTTPPDATILLSSPVEFEAPAEVIPGAPGTDHWVFEALAAGTTTFTLEYIGPGTDAEVGKTFTLTVVVE